MLTVHYSKINRTEWDKRFPNFPPKELACRCCGMLYLDIPAIDRLQRARDILGEPIYVNCGHRCPVHNAKVGGAPLSEHKKIAFDLSTRKTDRVKLFKALVAAGFTTFGLYITFIHTDPRPGRRWFGSEKARLLWKPLLES